MDGYYYPYNFYDDKLWTIEANELKNYEYKIFTQKCIDKVFELIEFFGSSKPRVGSLIVSLEENSAIPEGSSATWTIGHKTVSIPHEEVAELSRFIRHHRLSDSVNGFIRDFMKHRYIRTGVEKEDRFESLDLGE
jgi:hypothetical protein